MDAELLKQIDKYLQKELKGKDIASCKASAFPVSAFEFGDKSLMKDMDARVIRFRTKLLVKFSKAFMKAYTMINTDERSKKGSIAYYHFSSKGLAIPSLMNTIINKKLKSIEEG